MSHYLNEQRVLPVRDFHPSPDETTFDMLFQTRLGGKLYPEEDGLLHFWIVTRAQSPALVLPLAEEVRLAPERKIEGELPVFYLGATAAVNKGWAELRLEGLRRADLSSTFVVTSRTGPIEDAVFARARTIDDVERAVWGLSRRDVGTTSLDPDRVVVVDAQGRFRLTYRPGVDLPVGALVRLIMPRNFYNPERGHVVAVDRGRDKLAYCDRSAKPNAVVFRVTTPIVAGETLTVRLEGSSGLAFPCHADDPEGWWWYSRLPVFNLGVSLDGGKNFVSPAKEQTHEVTFLPGPAEAVHLFLPGRRHEGSPLEARALVTDRYRNPVHEDTTDLTQARLALVRDGVEVAHLGALKAFRETASRYRIPLPMLEKGVHRLIAYRPDTDRELARSNPCEIIAPDAGPELYWGGLHFHCSISDGIGDLDEVYDRARNEAALDFAALCEHAVYFTHNQWEQIQDLTFRENEDGRFVTLNAYEWGAMHPGDKKPTLYHINVYARDRMRKLTWFVPAAEGFARLKREVRDVVCQTHHAGEMCLRIHQIPGATELVRVFEVLSVFGRHERPHKIEPPVPGYLVDFLDAGLRYGLMGGGDSHCGYAAFGPKLPVAERARLSVNGYGLGHEYPTGVTALLADTLDQEHVLHSLGSRNIYATTGARILLDFSISGIPMGGEGTVTDVRIHCPIHAPGRLTKVAVIRDGEVLFERLLKDFDHVFDWTDATVRSGAHYYFLRVEQEEDEVAWTTPIWLRKV